MAIQNFFTSRDNNLDGNTYVGQLGRLWFNPDTNSIYASDGVTVGGVPVDLATGANAAFDGITVNTISSDDSTEVKFISDVTFDDEVSVNGNLVVFGNISAAAPNKIGGIAPGPGVNISNTGLLTIDSANLSFSFGNFTASNNILTIVNNDENMILETQGNAEIQLIGNVGFYRTNGGGVPDPANRTFRALDDGQITIFVANTDPLLGAVEIIGSTAGESIAPGITGAMLHITGQTDEDCRMYYDGIGGYVSFVGRRFNGNVASPTQVLSGQDVIRINATAATDAGVGNVAMAQISVTALENQTTTAQGSSITFTTTPVGQPATNRVDVATISVANGVSATQFNTTGNISAGNVNSFVTLPAGTAAQSPLVFTAGNIQIIPPTAGSMSYDGTVIYATPQANERGLMRTSQIFVPNANWTLTNQTALQSMMGASTTVSSSTRYAYRILSTVYKTDNNNVGLQYALGGTAVIARHNYQTLSTVSATLGTVTTPGVYKAVLTTNIGTAATITGVLNGAGFYTLQVNGVINVTTGGTWFPAIGFTDTPGATANVSAGSSIEIWPIGPTGANVEIGNWS